MIISRSVWSRCRAAMCVVGLLTAGYFMSWAAGVARFCEDRSPAARVEYSSTPRALRADSRHRGVISVVGIVQHRDQHFEVLLAIDNSSAKPLRLSRWDLEHWLRGAEIEQEDGSFALAFDQWPDEEPASLPDEASDTIVIQSGSKHFECICVNVNYMHQTPMRGALRSSGLGKGIRLRISGVVEFRSGTARPEQKPECFDASVGTWHMECDLR